MHSTAFGLLFLLLRLSGVASPPHRVTFRCEAGSWELFDDATGQAAPWTRGGDGVIEIRGRDEDDDWLTVDVRDASKCAALPDLRFDGGVGGWDGISIFDGGAHEVRYEPAEAGAGHIRIGSSTVAFFNLEPADFQGSASSFGFIVTAPAVLMVQNGYDFETGTQPALRISGTQAGGSPFETSAAWNFTHLAIQVSQIAGQVSSVTVQSADGAAAKITGFGIWSAEFPIGPVHGDIDVQGPMTFSGSVALQGDFVYETGNGKITAPVLSVNGGVQVSLGQPNVVGEFAATAGVSGLSFENDGSTRINGVTANGPVTLKVTNGTLDLAGPIVTPSSLTIQGPSTVKARRGGDTNHDGKVDVTDVFYLINFLFAGGPTLY